MRRALALAVLVLLALGVLAPPAAAHAELVSTTPASGARLDVAPARVSLRFSEPVEASFGAIRIFDSDGKRIDTPQTFEAGGGANTVRLALPRLNRGAYVVTWRVVSADSHPIHGAFTFRVGAAPAGDTDALVRRLLAADGGNTGVGVAYGLARFLGFVGITVLIGAAVFVLTTWPQGRDDRRIRRLLTVAWLMACVATVAGIVLQAAHGAGVELSEVVSVADDAASTRFGRAWLVRLALLVAAAPVVALVVRGRARPSRGAVVALALAAAGALVATSLAGHAGTESPAAARVALDALHLGAASVWLGGLAAIVVALGERREPPGLDTALPRFSRVAFWCVVTLLATGVAQGWLNAGSRAAVTGTAYGRLVLIKLGLLAAMVAFATVSRAWVRGRAGGNLRKSIGAEAAVAVLALAVTAVLVNAVPAKVALAQPHNAEVTAGSLSIEITVDPAKRGPTDIHVYTFTRDGSVTDVAELTAELRLPDQGVGPIKVPLLRAGPGHFSAYGVELPLPGQWQLDVVARLTDIDQVRGRAIIPVR